MTACLRSFAAPSPGNEILPGQYFDEETGLHQNWHRDYDPSIGRYLQSDPVLRPLLMNQATSRGRISLPSVVEVPLDLAEPRRLHPYGYVIANPIKFIDFFGLKPSIPCDKPRDVPCGYSGPNDDPYYSSSCCTERCWSFWKCDEWYHWIGVLSPAFCVGNAVGCTTTCAVKPDSY